MMENSSSTKGIILSSAVWERIIAASTPCPPPKKWRRLKTVGHKPAVIRLPEQTALEQLLTRFRMPKDQARELQAFLSASSLAIPLREYQDGPAFDLLINQSSIRASLPQFSVFDDIKFRGATDLFDDVFVTFSAADLAVLRQVGLPAIPCTGLHKITELDLRRLYAFYPVDPDWSLAPVARRCPPPTDNECYDDYAPMMITFVAWSPAEIAPQDYATLPAVQEHLSQMARVLRAPIECRVWQPDQKWLQQLKFAAANGACQSVRRMIRESVVAGSVLVCSRKQEELESDTYVRLMDCWHNSSSPDRDDDVLARLERLFRERLSRPLFAAADRPGMSTERIMYLALGLVSEAFQRTCLRHLLESRPPRFGISRHVSSHGNSEDVMKAADRIVNLIKEIAGCSTARPNRRR